jgi:hypothetical protein
MNTLFLTLSLLLSLLISFTTSQKQADSPKQTNEMEPLMMLRTYNDAIQHFKPEILQTIFAPDYTEVSPVGEVDKRSDVIRFYQPTTHPTGIKSIRLEEPSVRNYNNIAIVIGKEVFEREDCSTMSMRVTFVCRKEKKRWQLVSSQFTGIRPQKK